MINYMKKETKKMVVPSDIPGLLSSGTRILLPGKILLKPYGTMVWRKKKKAIVSSEKFAKYVDIPIYLIEDDRALAIIRIKPAKEIDKKGFKKLRKFHKISEKERKMLWPGEETFYYYAIEIISKFSPPKKIIKPEGAYSWLDSVVFKNLDIGDPSEFKNEDLIRGHDLIHGLWHRLDAPSDECIRYHILFRKEILRRKLKHKITDSLDTRSKEIEEKLSEKGYKVSFDKEKGLTKVEKSDEISKPYPGEHSCRLHSPGGYDRFARKNCAAKSNGKCIDHIYGIKEGKSELQAMRYKKNIWNASSARSHCQSNGGSFEAASGKAKEKVIRWNMTLSENFDVEEVESVPATFEYDMFSRFLDCDVKKIYQNDYLIPSPLTGTYLAGFKKVLSEFKLCDCRNFTYSGREIPPIYETIKLNSKSSDDFLINGTRFYEVDGKNKLVVKSEPSWFGINISLFSTFESRPWNKELLNKVHRWVKENNFLRKEKFALSGEFLEKDLNEGWDGLILDTETKEVIMKSLVGKKGLTSRGMMFIGEPGTGKTKTGRVLMNQIDSTFIWVSSKDFKKIDPVRALSLAFQLARDLSPAILFIEDIDTWLRDYTIDLLKTELDGLRQNKGVVTILTSNNPEKLPDTLLDRPGRFHDIIEFKLPNKEVRENMFESWIGKMGDYKKEIVEKTEGFSGAHMRELVDFAKVIAEEDEIEMDKALLISLKKMLAQRKLIRRIRSDVKEVDIGLKK